ncbi:MAG TPA: hypothetical protein VN238_10960 [Solirubrobacteraceae bacterium]|nr:hypothetical protein [Solirubrobacteraceae bacterium]
MRSLTLRRPSPALVVSIIALVVATSGVAVAANPFGSDGVIHACYNADQLADGGSTIIVVESAADCGTSDYADHFTFNAQGQPGAPGASGPQGPAGAAGAPGPAGQTVQAAPKVAAAEAAKLVQQLKQTETKVGKGAEQLDKLKEKLGNAKTPAQMQQQLEAMLKAVQQMLAALMNGQQTQQNALGSISSGIAMGAAQQKVKDAEKAKDAVDEATKQLGQADTRKEQQQAIDQMIKQIIAFMKELQEAQADQVRAISRP